MTACAERSLKAFQLLDHTTMNTSLVAFVVMLSLSAAGSTCASEVVACENVQKFRPKGSRTVKLKLTFKQGVLQELDYSGITASGEEGGAYSCDLSVQRDTPKTLWKTTGKSTKIWLEDNLDRDEPDMEVLLKGKVSDVKMNVAPTHYCGFGAEFPSRITKLPNGRCRVVF